MALKRTLLVGSTVLLILLNVHYCCASGPCDNCACFPLMTDISNHVYRLYPNLISIDTSCNDLGTGCDYGSASCWHLSESAHIYDHVPKNDCYDGGGRIALTQCAFVDWWTDGFEFDDVKDLPVTVTLSFNYSLSALSYLLLGPDEYQEYGGHANSQIHVLADGGDTTVYRELLPPSPPRYDYSLNSSGPGGPIIQKTTVSTLVPQVYTFLMHTDLELPWCRYDDPEDSSTELHRCGVADASTDLVVSYIDFDFHAKRWHIKFDPTPFVVDTLAGSEAKRMCSLTNYSPFTIRVGSASTSSPYFSASINYHIIPPGKATTLDITFEPTYPGIYFDYLVVETQPSSFTKTIKLTGRAYPDDDDKEKLKKNIPIDIKSEVFDAIIEFGLESIIPEVPNVIFPVTFTVDFGDNSSPFSSTVNSSLPSIGSVLHTYPSTGDDTYVATITAVDSLGLGLPAEAINAVAGPPISLAVGPSIIALYPPSIAGYRGAMDSFKTIIIIGGTPPYSAISNNTSVAECSVAGETIRVWSVAEGLAQVTITDNAGNSIDVPVGVGIPVSSGPASSPPMLELLLD